MLVSLASVGGAVALSDELHGIRFRIPFGIVAIALWTVRLRQYKRFTADIEYRIAEVLEGIPQRVWLAGRGGDCYLRLAGRTIKVPNDCYGALKEATIVKVAFLPTSHIAVRVDAGRGIGLSSNTLASGDWQAFRRRSVEAA
jgi:hypothetical protein